MNINLANIDFCPGGGSSEAKLAPTTAEILLTETEKVIMPPTGTDGFNKVTITHAPVEESVSATITENGTHTITPSEGFGAMFGVNVDVNVPSGDDVISYFYKKPTADDAGLGVIGWTDDDVNYYKYNNYAYPWEADNYKVREANMRIVINSKSDIATYASNPDFKYCPMFDTSADTSIMFKNCKYLKAIPQLDTSNVTNMSSMFNNCSSLTYISQLDTSNVTNMSSMFYGCSSLTYIPQLNTGRVTTTSSMFSGCTSLTSIPQLNTSRVGSMSSMFSGCTSLTSIPQLNTSRVTAMYNMFSNCPSLTTIPQLDTSNVTDMNEMFSNCVSLTSIPQLNTRRVTNMHSMFGDCTSLISVLKFDTSNVNTMSSMFNGCSSLTSVPQLNTSKVTAMSGMFKNCKSLTSVPQLDTSKVTDMSYMFYNCSSLTSIPRLDATSLTNTSYMFGYYNLNKFTDFGGMANLKVDLDLNSCPNLTKESLLNVFNEAADVTASPKTLTLGATNLAKLTDEDKAIATNKGWTLK